MRIYLAAVAVLLALAMMGVGEGKAPPPVDEAAFQQWLRDCDPETWIGKDGKYLFRFKEVSED